MNEAFDNEERVRELKGILSLGRWNIARLRQEGWKVVKESQRRGYGGLRIFKSSWRRGGEGVCISLEDDDDGGTGMGCELNGSRKLYLAERE